MARSLHRIAIDEAGDFGIKYRIIACPQDDSCAIWHECNMPDCLPPEDVDEASEGDHFRHGLVHRYLYGWFSRDDPHNCAVRWLDDLDLPGDAAAGDVFEFDLDYEDDGVWVPVGVTKVEAQ